MVYSVLWYGQDEAILVEMVGPYTLNDYVQACYLARDAFLDNTEQALNIILDFRTVTCRETHAIPIEPLESLLSHPKLKRVFFLSNPAMADLLARVLKHDVEIQRILVVESLDQVDDVL